MVHCSNCVCLCDDPASSTSHRHVSLLPSFTDTSDNMVRGATLSYPSTHLPVPPQPSPPINYILITYFHSHPPPSTRHHHLQLTTSLTATHQHSSTPPPGTDRYQVQQAQSRGGDGGAARPFHAPGAGRPLLPYLGPPPSSGPGEVS